jgi:CHAT domain-containing protein
MGVAAALLALGTSTVVASVAALPDEAARELMIRFHASLLRGANPAAALAEAQGQSGDDKLAAVASAGFVCLGAG